MLPTTDSALIQTLQRAINSVSDDTSQEIRLRALKQLHESFLGRLDDRQLDRQIPTGSGAGGRKVSKRGLCRSLLRRAFPHVMKPLLRRFADPVEKCRELALRMTTKFVESLENYGEVLPYVEEREREREQNPPLCIDYSVYHIVWCGVWFVLKRHGVALYGVAMVM